MTIPLEIKLVYKLTNTLIYSGWIDGIEQNLRRVTNFDIPFFGYSSNCIYQYRLCGVKVDERIRYFIALGNKVELDVKDIDSPRWSSFGDFTIVEYEMYNQTIDYNYNVRMFLNVLANILLVGNRPSPEEKPKGISEKTERWLERWHRRGK